jgi:hypothetical protein
MNFYFGRNMAEDKERVMILRTAYAAGTSSIGLNPYTMKVHGIFPEMAQLMGLAHDVVMKDAAFAPTMAGRVFNFCSVKIYFAYQDKNGKWVRKYTNWHLDISHNKNTKEPLSTNSQVPGTPVVIILQPLVTPRTFSSVNICLMANTTTKVRAFSIVGTFDRK